MKLRKVVKAAREAGLTYGEYVAKFLGNREPVKAKPLPEGAKVCEVCGSLISANSRRTRYCSAVCSAIGNAKKKQGNTGAETPQKRTEQKTCKHGMVPEWCRRFECKSAVDCDYYNTYGRCTPACGAVKQCKHCKSYAKAGNVEPEITATCVQCGKPLEIVNKAAPPRKYCSDECAVAAKREQYAERMKNPEYAAHLRERQRQYRESKKQEKEGTK